MAAIIGQELTHGFDDEGAKFDAYGNLKMWWTEADFKKFAAKNSPATLLGYTIINDKESLGEILELIEQPHQMLCRLEVKGKEVLIPLHEETLKKVDHKNKEIFVELPDGLLDIYLK